MGAIGVQMFSQTLVDGITLGMIYAAVALGYSMVYGILKLVNFAHGEIFMIGAFVGTETLLLLQSNGILEHLPPLVSFIIAVLIAMVISGTIGITVERVAYRPLRNAPRLVPWISAFGVSFLLQDLVRFIEGWSRNQFYLNMPSLFNEKYTLFIGVKISEKSIILFGFIIIGLFTLNWFISKTKWGLAMRAVAEDPSAASLMRIDINKVIMMVFLIGSALGGASGVLFAQQFGTIDPFIGFLLGMKAFTAAVVGGIGNLKGAIIGGLLIGLLESLGSAYLGNVTNGAFGAEYKDVFAFAVLIIVLIFKPEGLLGKVVKEKV